jgi:hypothetical protein
MARESPPKTATETADLVRHLAELDKDALLAFIDQVRDLEIVARSLLRERWKRERQRKKREAADVP